MKNSPTVVELFCGVGGMGLGFKQAGFNIVQAFDNNPHALAMHLVNFPECEVQNLDILQLERVEADIIIAGPPCQGFSQIGKQDLLDPRNQLIVHTAQLITNSDPDYFVIENVVGLTSQKFAPILEEVYSRIERKYSVITYKLNAVDFGIPQKRRRIFIVGVKSNGRLKHPSKVVPSSERYTVRDAIADLPEQGEYQVNSAYKGRSAYSAELQREGDITNCNSTKHSEEIIARFAKIEPGKKDFISHRDRLCWEQPSPTILAGSLATRRAACWPIHPDIPRAITVREAARLSSFPDDFIFSRETYLASSQIGNAVPPKLSFNLAKSIQYVTKT